MKNTNKYTADALTNVNSIVKIPRTTFRMPEKLQTAFNGGKLIPLKVMECYPGDTIKMNMSSLVRVASPFIKAPMGEIEFSAYAFKVPNRILLDDWEEIIANYQPNPDWTSDVANSVPGLIVPVSGGFAVNSVADYLGLPVLKNRQSDATITKFNILPVRAYVKIGDEWFRDENLMNTAGVNTANVDTQGTNSIAGSYLTNAIKGGALYPVCKLKAGDPFTTTLPGVQKGAPVIVSLGSSAPLTSSGDIKLNTSANDWYQFDSRVTPFDVICDIGSVTPDIPLSTGVNYQKNYIGISGSSGNPARFYYGASNNSSTSMVSGKEVKGWNVYVDGDDLTSKVSVDLSNASAISVPALRLAVQLSKIKEADAIYGTRYPEYLRGRWGVKCSDGRLQIPEYLGSHKMTLNINQVVQTSQTDATSAQGNVSGYSATQNKNFMFETSCTEHCYIMIVGCCRIKHRPYSQGVPHWALNRTREDFYVPELANISAQPVKNAEIYFSGTSTDNQNFGYKEAFWWMRMSPNKTTGLMRPGVTGSLAVWNFADNYASLPTLSSSWIVEDMTALDRCLAYPSTSGVPHFIADFVFDCVATRPIPLHSVPGLMDHSWGYRW